MVGSINKVILVGNLGADPKVSNTANGAKIVIFNPNLADVAERYLRKGSKVYLEGQLQTRRWEDNSGQERYTTEVVLQNFNGNMVLLDGRGDGVPAGGNDVFGASDSGWDSTPAAPAASGLDDDIPF